MNINYEIHNEFEIIKRDARTGEIIERAKSYNILLNQFWTMFLSASNGSTLSHIHFGSGTATPVATDKSLTSFLGAKAATNVSQDLSTLETDGIIKKKAQIRLEDTEYVGQTISEVGFGSSTSASSLRTKSLVKDQNGNPLSIVKGAGEVIDIFATFFARVPSPWNGGKVYFDKSQYPLSGLLSFLTCGGVTSLNAIKFHAGKSRPKVIGESEAFNSDIATITYDVGGKKLTLAIPNIVASVGNIGGIESIKNTNVVYVLPCDGFTQPVLIKEVIATGDGTVKDFKCSFGRILNNGTAKLYVNDVEVSASFDYEMPPANVNISDWLPRISGDIAGGTSSDPVVFENPYYAKFGLSGIYGRYFNLYASDDGNTWSLAASRSSSSSNALVVITATYKNYRYWKIEPYGESSNYVMSRIESQDCLNNLVIHADVAPPSGATVALTYQPDCIAKDASHVVNNMSIVWTFNEYTP